MLFHKVFMHNLVPQGSRDKEFKVMKRTPGLPEHTSTELTLGAGRKPDLSRQGE